MRERAAANVAAPILAISPPFGNPQSTQTLTLTGTNTVWTQEAVSGWFALSGGTGASLGTPAIIADGTGSVTLIVGSGTGTLTITDTSVGQSATFVAGAKAGGTCAVVWGQ